MNYAVGCAFNLDEMFMNFPYSKLKFTCAKAKEINGDAHRKILVKKVFRECLKMVIDDIIENNITFKLPTGGINSELHMRRVKGRDFEKARQNGKFQDVDYLSSLFSGYEIELNMYHKNRVRRSKTVYVDKKRKQRITELTNAKKSYC